jgi:hypothetical protein
LSCSSCGNGWSGERGIRVSHATAKRIVVALFVLDVLLILAMSLG